MNWVRSTKMNAPLQRKSGPLLDITKVFPTEGDKIDPVYIPDPDRKLPKPIGFELRFNSKINLQTHSRKPSPSLEKPLGISSPPGLELSNNHPELKKSGKKPVIIPPVCSFRKEPKNKLKLYELKLDKRENVSGDGLPVRKNIWIKVDTDRKKPKIEIIERRIDKRAKKLSPLSQNNRKTRKKSYRKPKRRGRSSKSYGFKGTPPRRDYKITKFAN